ncbi:signal peptidase I [Patescibacteria group bacterium]|nr:signal peptidase I [Patescibacteria group bacterium]
MAKDQKQTPPPIRRKSSDFDPTLNPDFATVPAEAEQPSSSERALHALWEIAKTVAFIIIAAVIIRAFLLQPFFVQGESMESNFHDGNYLLVNQLSYKLGKPERGDVVVFKAPPEPDTNFIKRIIGLPGETVELRNNQVIIFNAEHRDGVTLDESYEPAGVKTLPEISQTKWELGPDQYFVLGDNREPEKSSDSRAWGILPKDNLIGKAWIRVYPLAEVGVVKHERYPDLSFSGATLLAQP